MKTMNNISGRINCINLELTVKIGMKKKSASHINNMTKFSLYHPILLSSVRTRFSKIDAMLHLKKVLFRNHYQIIPNHHFEKFLCYNQIDFPRTFEMQQIIHIRFIPHLVNPCETSAIINKTNIIATM